MSVPALVPALVIVAGVAAGVLLPGPPHYGVLIPLAAGHAAAGVALALRRPLPLLVALPLVFALAGYVVGADAAERTLRPSLGALFDQESVEGDDEPAAGTSVRVPEASLAATIEGTLGGDAWVTPFGVGLSLRVRRVRTGPIWREVRGGVRVSVAGDLARQRAEAWRAGRRVVAPVLLRQTRRYLDPGVPDHRLQLARRGTILVGSTKSGALVELTAPGNPVAEVAAEARSRARRVLERHVGRWSPTSQAIVTAILIGDRSRLDERLEQRLQEAGTYHVIAISGGNIAILTAFLLGVLGAFGLAGRGGCLAASFGLAGYAYLVGGGPSVNRATLMATTYLAARMTDHRSDPLNAVAVAAAVAVLASPLSLFDPGLALTFGATLGILAGARWSAVWLPRRTILRAAAALLVASLSAETALFPVSALVFSRVTFAGLVLNFIAIPLMAMVQVAGLSVLGLASMSDALASAAGFLAHIGAAGLVGSAALVDVAPWLSLRVPPPPVGVVVTYYAAWLARLAAGWANGAGAGGSGACRVAAIASTAVVVVAGASILTAPAATSGRAADGRLRVTFLDVGQGDAILVRTPTGRTLLVDTGGLRTGAFDVGSRVVSPSLWALGVRRLDVLAITHPDPDHIGGARSVVRDFRPREIWEGVPVASNEPRAALRDAAARAGVSWRTLEAGARLTLGGVEVVVWHPPAADWERQRVRNDDSLVLEIGLGGVSVLLPGDISAAVEHGLAAGFRHAAIRILKIPHHGSAGSSSPVFVDAVRPVVAVLSTGAGGWLGRATLARYAAAGAAIFRTDRDGAITVDTDGRTIEVTTMTGRRARFPDP